MPASVQLTPYLLVTICGNTTPRDNIPTQLLIRDPWNNSLFKNWTFRADVRKVQVPEFKCNDSWKWNYWIYLWLSRWEVKCLCSTSRLTANTFATFKGLPLAYDDKTAEEICLNLSDVASKCSILHLSARYFMSTSALFVSPVISSTYLYKQLVSNITLGIWTEWMRCHWNISLTISISFMSWIKSCFSSKTEMLSMVGWWVCGIAW